MASLIRNAEAAPAVVQLVLFPLVFISGTYTPIHSDLLNRITAALPVRPFNQALPGPFAQHTGFDWKTSPSYSPGAPPAQSSPSAASAGTPTPMNAAHAASELSATPARNAQWAHIGLMPTR